MTLIRMSDVHKTYSLGQTKVQALSNIDLEIKQGEFAAVWGPSGSGKSTLLNLMGFIDKPGEGSIYLNGERVDQMSDNELAELRNEYVGFVFQNFNLVPVLNACENVMLPLQIGGASASHARDQAMACLEAVNLQEHAAKRPDQLSGGQRQRVAIARALVGSPSLVIADEPTANLDSETSMKIIKLMRELNQRDRVTFVFSTHDPRLLDHVDRRLRLVDGQLIESEGAESVSNSDIRTLEQVN